MSRYEDDDPEPPAPTGTGRPMIAQLRTLEAFNLKKAETEPDGDEWANLAVVVGVAAQCIENEARRADLAEWRLRRMGWNVER